MKTILSLRRHHYLKTVSIFLIAVILIAGVASCTGAPKYDLTMAVAPPGGGTATDETGTSPYERAAVVDIKAVPNPCYRFVSWTAQAGQFGNSSAPETTFTMPAEDVTVTANFEPVPADHYKLYWAEWGAAPPETFPADVQLVDQFGTFNATVGEVYWFGNPVEKVHDGVTPISDRDRHYTFYHLDYDEGWMPSSFQVTVNNQFQDDVELTVQGPYFLAVPTQKEDQEMSDCLDHLLVYEIVLSGEPEPIAEVDLHDQFQDEQGVTVYEPVLFANPVKKTWGSEVSEIQADEHYVFYPIDGESFVPDIQIDNQFGEQTLDLFNPELLAVPSEKISWEQPLDHLKVYWTTWADEPPETFPAAVQLEDQFIEDWLGEPLNATVYDPYLFANPVNKGHGEVWTPISDPKDHYTFYWIGYDETPQVWAVTVSNQFDPIAPLVEPPTMYQELVVWGPRLLAVPTQKGPHDPPVNLDYLLVYEVLGEPPVLLEEVWLYDQFTEQWATVYPAAYFAIPAQKIYKGEETEIIKNEHMVLYWIDGGMFYEEWLPIDNQFGQQFLYVAQDEYDFLAVPSEKIDWEWLGPYD